MASYPYLVQTAWYVIEAFIADWQREPYLWAREIDAQAEIASRLMNIYKLVGSDTLLGNYKGAPEGFEHNQRWSRVTCEPYVYYTYSDGKQYRCHPDIIVWDEINDPNSPPDQCEGKNWPILWACEIKYDVADPDTWDIKKLRYLIQQDHIKFGCWLKFKRMHATTGNGIKWDKDQAGARLWECNVSLPSV